LDDASVKSPVFIGTLRSVLLCLWDMGLNVALVRAAPASTKTPTTTTTTPINVPTTVPTTPNLLTGGTPPDARAKVYPSDSATSKIGERESLAAIGEVQTHVKDYLSNSFAGNLTQFSLVTSFTPQASLWMNPAFL
jgi:hypothetical protein